MGTSCIYYCWTFRHLETLYYSNWYIWSTLTPWEYNFPFAASMPVEHWQESAFLSLCLQRQQSGQGFTAFVTLRRGCSAVPLPQIVCADMSSHLLHTCYLPSSLLSAIARCLLKFPVSYKWLFVLSCLLVGLVIWFQVEIFTLVL